MLHSDNEQNTTPLIPRAIQDLRQRARKTSDCAQQKTYEASISLADQHADAFYLWFHVNIYQLYHSVDSRILSFH